MTIYINPTTGKDTAAGTVTAPLKTITKALSQIKAGTLIQLATGSYTTTSGEVFPLAIPAGVTIIGNEISKGKGIIIAGTGTYNSPTFGNQAIALRLETGAQLRGVTVSNNIQRGTGVWVESTAPIIANNTFTLNGREGVFVSGTGKPLIVDNLFLQNASSGISMARSAKGEIRRNTIQKGGYGIAMTDTASPLLADNKISSAYAGIVLAGNVRPVLRRNLVEKNSNGGLIVNDTARPELGSSQDPAGNIFRDNGTVDLQNTTALELIAVGNLLNPSRIQGQVSFPVAQVIAPITGPTQFSDVLGHWAQQFIQPLVNRGLITGFPDGTFQPEASLTRAQYAAIIAKTFDLPPRGSNTVVFSDVSSTFWASGAILKAARMGFITGFPDGTFRPGQNLTRVQALVSLVSGLGITGGNSTLLGFYRDRAAIPSYGTNAIAAATQRQMVVNYPDPAQLQPMRPITRAEVAALIYQALVATNQAEALPSPYIVNPESFASSFTDISQHWAAAYIRPLSNLDLISGFADGTFKPDEPLNRAQYATLVVKAFNPPSKRPAMTFIDVGSDFWALPAITQAYCSGFISGFPDQTFHPEQNLLRVQLIISLVNGLALPMGKEADLDVYEDRAQIPTYGRLAVAAATQARLVVNYPEGNLRPNQDITRGEAAAFIHQALVITGRLGAIQLTI